MSIPNKTNFRENAPLLIENSLQNNATSYTNPSPGSFDFKNVRKLPLSSNLNNQHETNNSNNKTNNGNATGDNGNSDDRIDNDEESIMSVQQVDYSANTVRLVSLLVMLFYGMSLGATIPLISQYLEDRYRREAGYNGSVTANHSLCGVKDSSVKSIEDDISARVSNDGTFYNYVSSVLSIISCLIMGAYADTIGRRKIIILSAFGAVAYYIFIICIIRFDMNTNYFYVGSAAIGICGSIYSMLVGIFSAMADIHVVKSNRVFWVALQTCVNSVTFAGGNIALGFVIKYLGYFEASLIWVVPAVLALFIAFFFMPETLPKTSKKSEKKLSPWKNISRVFSVYTIGSRRTRISLLMLLLMFFFGVIPDLQLSTIDTIYQLHEPLCWDSTLVGYYGALQSGGKKLLGIALLKIIQFSGWIRDEKLAMVALVFQCGSMVMEAFVQTDLQMFFVPVVGIPGVITIPVFRGLMSFLVGPHNQGALFASVAVVETSSAIATSTLVNRVYTATVGVMPGAVYLLMASFAVINFILFFPFFHFYDDPTQVKSVKLNKDTQDQ